MTSNYLNYIICFIFVKTPLLPVHIWLPLAHSDANVSGSIILASIVLKLALYGFLRILIAIFFIGTAWLTPFILGLCSISVAYSSFTTIRQFDLKVLVAYSSIAHMASSLLGTFSDTLYGLIGSIIFGLAHGFVSPGLFIIVGAVLYDRCGSRIINYYRGLNAILPFLALIFLILVFGNMGVPLTGNFIGEFLSLLGAYQQNLFIASVGALSIILSAVYSIFMYNRVTSGSISPYIHVIPDIFRKEYYILIPLIILTILLGIYPSFISADIEFGLSNFLFMTSLPILSNSKNNPNISSLLNLGDINITNKNYKTNNEISLFVYKYIDKKTKNNLELNILDNFDNDLRMESESKNNKFKEDLIKAAVPWEDKPTRPNWPWENEDEDSDPIYNPWPESDPDNDEEENGIIRPGSPDSSLDSDWDDDSDLEDELERGDIIDPEEEDLFEEDERDDGYSEEEYSESDSDSEGSDSNPSSSDSSSSSPSSSDSLSSNPSSSNDGSSNFNTRDPLANKKDNIDGFVNEYEPNDKVNIESYYDSICDEDFMIYRDNIYNYLNILKIINEEIINNIYWSVNNIMLLKDILFLFIFSILIILGSYVLYLKINYLLDKTLKYIFNIKYSYNLKLIYRIKDFYLYSVFKFTKSNTNFWYIISKDKIKFLLLLRKKFFIFVIFIFLPWFITTYPHLLGIDIEYGLSHFLLTGNLWTTMTALIFEKAEIKSETLHKNANNPHTTPVVDKVVPDIGGKNDIKDQNSTNLANSDDKSNLANTKNTNSTNSDDKSNLANTENKSNQKNIENKLISTDSAKNENLENTDKNENQKSGDKNEKIENILKNESIGNTENKQDSEIIKNNTNSVNSGDDSNELDKRIQNISLNDRSRSTSDSISSSEKSEDLPSSEESVGLLSEEGKSRYVGLKDYENQPVNGGDLRTKIENLPPIIEAEKISYIQDRTIEKYNSMTPEEYKIYCENNSTRPPTNPTIPQDKIINVVRWPVRKNEDSDDDSPRGSDIQGSSNRTTTSSESSSNTRSVDTNFVDRNGTPLHGLNDNNLDYSIYNLLKMNFSFSFEDIILFINQIDISTYNISMLKFFIVFIPFIFYTIRFYILYLYIKLNKEQIYMVFFKFKYIYYLNLKNIVKKYLF